MITDSQLHQMALCPKVDDVVPLVKELRELREEVETWKSRAEINGNLGIKYRDETHVLRGQLFEAREVISTFVRNFERDAECQCCNNNEALQLEPRAYLEKWK